MSPLAEGRELKYFNRQRIRFENAPSPLAEGRELKCVLLLIIPRT